MAWGRACSYGKRKGWRVGKQLDLELWMLCLGIWTLSKGFTRIILWDGDRKERSFVWLKLFERHQLRQS